MSVENKVTIITGGAQGIGLACGERFASDGARVVLADINDEKGEAAAEAIRADGGDAIFVHCDVGDKAEVESLVKQTVDRHGRLDVMISNAAILHIANILDLEEEDYDRVVRVNLKGFFLSGQAAARQIVEDEGLSVARSLVGNYVTSLEMAGCSLTLSLLDDERADLWDAPVQTAALRWGM